MSDEEIIALLKSTETDQRRGLMLLYQGKGREFGRYFLRSGMPEGRAEEAVQELIIKILRHAKDFKGEGSAKAWIWTMARNAKKDWVRQKIRNPEINLHEDEWAAGVYIEKDEKGERVKPLNSINPENDSSRDVENCVQGGVRRFSIDEPERAYAISLHIDGIDNKEIAERIGRTYDATRQYLLQCRQKIAPYISGCLELLKA